MLLLLPLTILTAHIASTKLIKDEFHTARYQVSIQRMKQNIHKGTIIASPSQQNPNYYYSWIRDAALVIKSMLSDSSNHSSTVLDYVQVSVCQQRNGNLGEPKFNVDGSVFTGPWGRPQNDGPALRVLALVKYQQIYGFRDDWYIAKLPAESIIKKDLEYIAHNWNLKNYDLWEEVEGHHFYTRMVQYSALCAGVEIATMFNDNGAAEFYRKQMKIVQSEMDMFWDSGRKFIKATIDPVDSHGKSTQLDIAVILACLHTRAYPLYKYACTSDRILSTSLKILSAFEVEYEINYGREIVLLGRYPEDVYDGTGMSLGNPWVLATHAFAELLYELSNRYSSIDSLYITQASFGFFSKIVPQIKLRPGLDVDGPLLKYLIGNLTRVGDLYMDRVAEYVSDGDFSEQIHRGTGEIIGANNLTWSYASFVTAINTRLVNSKGVKLFTIA